MTDSSSERSDNRKHDGPSPPSRWKWFLLGFVAGAGLLILVRWLPTEDVQGSTKLTPLTATGQDAASGEGPQPQTMEEVLALAREGLEHLETNVDDYTARLVKQERVDGKLHPEQEMEMKIQTRRTEDGKVVRPMRVYLRFLSPNDVDGREVIWAEDLHDGKLIVHEAGWKGLLPVPPLDPHGLLAMMGNRYPITEIGLTNLIRKLIERGEEDLNDPNTSIVTTQGHQVGDRLCTLIRVIHAKPDGSENDFAVAEIAIDAERKIPLRYTAFGWPNEADGDDAEHPLLESYTYHDLELNVGLTASDFDPENPAYNFP